MNCPDTSSLRRRSTIAVLLLCLAAATAVAGTGPTAAAGAAETAPPEVWAGLDLVDRGDSSTRVIGWAATHGTEAPTVSIVIDGRRHETRPDIGRFDVSLLVPGDLGLWGWDVTIDAAATESVCVSVRSDGVDHAVDCWSRNRSTMLPAIGEGSVLGSSGRLIRYSVEVEAATGFHPEAVARVVDTALGDARSWAASGEVRFQRVRPENTDLRIILATPATTDRLCVPFNTGGQLSCNVSNVRIVFNLNRWTDAVRHWTESLDLYRMYLVNHEVGHTLDYRHVGCPGAGELAPVMMQQSKSVGACRPNGWPYPDAGSCFGRTPTISAAVGRPTTGTSGDDVIIGTAGPDVISGLGGNDRICALTGADDVDGGGGTDRINGGAGPDVLVGGDDNDRIWGKGGADLLLGDAGNDVLRGGKGADGIDGGPGNDACAGGSGRNELSSC